LPDDLARWFSASSFLPHGYCFTWDPALLWSLVVGDGLIALAYFSIPVALLTLLRKRRDIGQSGVAGLFAAFIFLCGITHLLSIWTIWVPDYWVEAAVKLVTGVVSVATAVLLWPLIPKVLRLPSVNQLQAAIARLETEAVERRRAEARLAHVNADLERRIQERTAELEREVAERQRLQEADRARQAAELASAAKSEFLSRMSHELRTPLNAVLGFAQLSGRALGDGDVARTRTYLQHIEDGGWHLVRMIDDILDISRIEQGRQSFTIGAVDLDAVIAEAHAMAQPLAAERHVALVCDFSGPLPPVKADRTRLIQVMTNLLSNATKFNRNGGEVHIAAEPRNERQLEIRVRDTGLGMSQAQLAQLFQPFNRLGRERLGIPGTGIGLVLVRHLVEQMGGTIEVQSTEGVGTTVIVTLQRDDAVASDAVAREQRAPFAAPPQLTPPHDRRH
jgi:signal transduction histidine kinase